MYAPPRRSCYSPPARFAVDTWLAAHALNQALMAGWAWLMSLGPRVDLTGLSKYLGSMRAPEVPFSDLQLHAKDTVAKLKASRTRSLRLRRRDDEDLVLTTAARAEQEGAVVSATTRMFVALMQRDDAARSLLVDVVPEVFPWVRFLPVEEVRAFVLELVETLRGADALENPAPVVQVISAWQSTAEVYADPELAAVLSGDGADYGPVPAPSVVA